MARGEIITPKNAGQIITPPKPPCSFCEPQTTQYPHFAAYGRGRIDLVHLLETEHAYVKPDILPSSPDGHLLLIPKPHGTSFAALPQLTSEIGQLLYQTEQILQRPVVFFEHGSIEEGAKVQSVYHQHAHIIPDGSSNVLDFMRDWLNKLGIPHEVIDTSDPSPIANLKRHFDGFNYLYIQQGRVGLMAHDNLDGKPTDAFPSQITQRGASRLFHGRELNWKQIAQSDELARLSVQTIAHIVDDCNFPRPTQAGLQGIR